VSLANGRSQRCTAKISGRPNALPDCYLFVVPEQKPIPFNPKDDQSNHNRWRKKAANQAQQYARIRHFNRF
jgi:hypothetical protein